ncbi:MAG: amino acid ABC transporter substrate-binding protein [Clostridia bacterium]|nr:amino acid ABC transporter substrate-binding protein [Clostridia bacterium]
MRAHTGHAKRLAVLILALAFCAAAAGETVVYTRNEWNYVSDSMDISGGIPADAQGRLAQIREKGVLRVVTEPYYPPQEFIDPSLSGQERFVGADMELARLIAQRMGVELEIVPRDFSDVLDTIAEGQYDLAISGLSFTSGRAARMEMSKGYHYTSEGVSSGVIIRSADAEAIRTEDDLNGRDIVAQSGSLQETMAAENITDYRQFRRLNLVQDVYDAVAEGSADAGVVDVENALIYIAANPDCGLSLAPEISFTLEPQYEGDRVAGPRGETQLMAFVNGVIDEVLESGQYERWYDEYTAYAERIGQ